MHSFGLCQCCWNKHSDRPQIYPPYNMSATRSGFPRQRVHNILTLCEYHASAVKIVCAFMPIQDIVGIISGYLESVEPPKKRPKVEGKNSKEADWVIPKNFTTTQQGHYKRHAHLLRGY
jgi:hypothetical protein